MRDADRRFRGFRATFQSPTLKLGYFLQRLFSTFPNGWPGLGLLLLRLALGVALIGFAVAGIANPSDQVAFARAIISATGGLFLLAGLWTPVMGILTAFDQLWTVSTLDSLLRHEVRIHILLTVIAISLAMLGPGAWSLDARLFGRKRFDLDRTRVKRPSH